jgi:hypothetical protein
LQFQVLFCKNMMFLVFIITASAAQCVFNLFDCCVQPMQAQHGNEVTFSTDNDYMHLDTDTVDTQSVIEEEGALKLIISGPLSASAHRPHKTQIAARESDEVLFIPANSNNGDVNGSRVSEFSHATTASLVGFTQSDAKVWSEQLREYRDSMSGWKSIQILERSIKRAKSLGKKKNNLDSVSAENNVSRIANAQI